MNNEDTRLRALAYVRQWQALESLAAMKQEVIEEGDMVNFMQSILITEQHLTLKNNYENKPKKK